MPKFTKYLGCVQEKNCMVIHLKDSQNQANQSLIKRFEISNQFIIFNILLSNKINSDCS